MGWAFMSCAVSCIAGIIYESQADTLFELPPQLKILHVAGHVMANNVDAWHRRMAQS